MIGAPRDPRKAGWRTGEIALLVALGALAVIAWANAPEVPLSVGASLVTVGILFAVAAAALGEGQTGWRYWIRELLPIPVVPFVYLNLGRLIPLVNGNVYDPQLERLDRVLLGPEAQAALYALPLPAWLADLLTVAYSTFFFLPIVLLVALARRRDPLTGRAVSALIITFLASYAGYFAVPAYGPRATVARERYATLPEGLVGAPIRDLLDHWEKTKTDAFPSGHTMVTLAVLLFARRRVRGLYNAILPVGALLIAATVLLTYHWVVDVLAAPPLLAAALAFARAIDGRIPAVATTPRQTSPS